MYIILHDIGIPTQLKNIIYLIYLLKWLYLTVNFYKGILYFIYVLRIAYTYEYFVNNVVHSKKKF